MNSSMLSSGSRRGGRLALYLPLIAFLVAAIGWSALWLYGRYRVTQEIEAAFLREAARGREWTCPNQSITGYPFRIVLRCDQPRFKGTAGAGSLEGQLKSLTVIAMTASALSAAHVITEAEGPLTLRDSGDGGGLTMTWKTARSSVRGASSRLERFSLEVEAPVISVSAPGFQELKISGEKLGLHLAEGTNQAEPNTYNLAFNIDKLVAPPLDLLVGNRDAGDLAFDARLQKVAAINRQDWRASLETWRLGGGTMRVEKLRVAKGAPRFEARGDLQLDEARRLAGRLDAEFVNADQLLRQFGIGGNAGGLIGALLGGGAPGSQTRAERSMRLPLVLGDGRVSVGPFRIPGLTLRPLY